MCACDLEPCPACAARERAEWEPDPREQAERDRYEAWAAFADGRSIFDPELP